MKKKKLSTSQPIVRYTPSPSFGLTENQVSEREKNYLVNKVQQKYSKTYLSIFVGNVFTFFNLLGLIVFIALLSVQANLSDFFFVVIYVTNIGIGIIQEIRAKKCIERLSILANNNAVVVRNGVEKEVDIKSIVLDDVIKLTLGKQVPTDCKIIEGEIEVNESLLTGESVPIKKSVNDTLFAGSFVTSGNCYVQAVKVGADNYVEQLSAKAKKYKKPHSEIMNSLKFIIKTVGFVIIPMAILYMLKSTLISQVLVSDAVKGTSAVIIGMIPSGMFLLTSLSLAVGIIKLARHKTFVQDLYSLEMLARVDTICFDKTGTITDGKMTVSELVPLSNENVCVKDVISSMMFVLKDNNQTAIALQNYFGQEKVYNDVYSIPFNSGKKMSVVAFENLGTFAIGAPEFILSKEKLLLINERIEYYSKQGCRVLLLAKSNDIITCDELRTDFAPVSLIVIVDNIREDAFSTIKWFKDNNVNIKIISGDNPLTVAEVSKRAGVDNADKYVSLDGLSDQEVYNSAQEYTIFGRVTPEQKAILVRALKDAGHTTAMTGDGVNDIIALKEADCAISIASGSEAARNVAHLVLMDDNFNSMPKIVYEGRRVINNIQSSSSLYLMKTLFVMILAFVALFIPNVGTYPFTLKQMNILEVAIIGLPSFMLSLQPNDSLVEGKFIRQVLRRTLPSSCIMLFNVLIIFVLRLILNLPSESYTKELYSTMEVLGFTFAGLVSLFYICKPFNKYRTALISCVSVILVTITAIVITSGLPFLGLEKFLPFEKYWHHVLIVVAVLLVDIPLFPLLTKLFKFIKIAKRIELKIK